MASPDTPSARLLVRPRTAREMLSCGVERLYQLLNAGELESFRDGRARYITIHSIERYITKRLAESGGPPSSSPAANPPRRGRPPRVRSAEPAKHPTSARPIADEARGRHDETTSTS